MSELFCAVLCTTVVHNYIHVYKQFFKMNLGLGLAFCVYFWFSLDYFVLVLFAFVVLDLVSSVLWQEIGSVEHLRNDLFCVEWAIKT